MKILAAGDIHGDQFLAEKLAKKAVDNKVDYVILCGDLTQFDFSTDNLIKPFKERKLKVVFVPGNHDSFATADFLTEFYNIRNLHGSYMKTPDIGIFGCGGANIGLEQLSETEIFDTLKYGHDKISDLKKQIMVTHVHPSKTMMEKFSNFIPGSDGVKKAIDEFKPNIVLCSHVHEAEGIEEVVGQTKIINVGKQGKIIEL